MSDEITRHDPRRDAARRRYNYQLEELTTFFETLARDARQGEETQET